MLHKPERKQSVLWAIQKLRINPVDTCHRGICKSIFTAHQASSDNNTAKVREFLIMGVIMGVWSLDLYVEEEKACAVTREMPRNKNKKNRTNTTETTSDLKSIRIKIRLKMKV